MYYQHLDLGIGPILNDETILYVDSPNFHYQLSILDLNPNFIRLIEKKNLVITLIEVFRLDSTIKQWPIHVDGWEVNDFPKLNFIYGNKNSPMIWYTVNEGINKKPIETGIGTPYLHFEHDEVAEADRTFINYPTLVQAGVPHTVIHTGPETRWAISITFMKNFKFLSMKDLSEIFQEYHQPT